MDVEVCLLYDLVAAIAHPEEKGISSHRGLPSAVPRVEIWHEALLGNGQSDSMPGGGSGLIVSEVLHVADRNSEISG